MSFYPPSVIVPIYALFMSIGVVLLGIRIWVRVALSHFAFGADDSFAAASVVFVSCCTAIQLWNATDGTGGNLVDENFGPDELETANKVNTSQAMLEVLAVGSIKLALLFFYRRIFGIDVVFRRWSMYSIYLIVAWTIAFFIAQMSICGDHMSYMWLVDQTLAKEHCGNKALLLLLFAVTSVLTDLLVLALPIFFLGKMQMPANKKWAAGMIFILGAISTFACVLRTVFLCVAYPQGTMDWAYVAKPGDEPSVAMQAFNPTFWIMVEMWLGSWASNMLPMGPLYLSLCGSRRHRGTGSRTTPQGDFSQVYEMRSSKARDIVTTQNIDADAGSDSAPIMARSRDTSQVSF